MAEPEDLWHPIGRLQKRTMLQNWETVSRGFLKKFGEKLQLVKSTIFTYKDAVANADVLLFYNFVIFYMNHKIGGTQFLQKEGDNINKVTTQAKRIFEALDLAAIESRVLELCSNRYDTHSSTESPLSNERRIWTQSITALLFIYELEFFFYYSLIQFFVLPVIRLHDIMQ